MDEQETIPAETEPGKKRNTRKRIKKITEITIATTNVRGAKGKTKSLESLVNSQKIGITIITEFMFNNKEGYNTKG